MADEEEEEEQPRAVKQIVKGGANRVPVCNSNLYYATVFSYYPVTGLYCKTPGHANPTRIYQCMKPKKPDLPCTPPPGQGGAGDQFPPQGGTLTKTCGVKAQFMGDIIIKQEIPPKEEETGEDPCPKPAPPSPCPPPGPCFSPCPCPMPCPGPCRRLFSIPTKPYDIPIACPRNMAPMCGPVEFPLQPEIPDSTRRKLKEFGPDSSRPHPCGPSEEPVICPHPCGHPAQDVLPFGQADSYETVRTREEIIVDSMDPCLNPLPEKKYVKIEDTFRKVRSYNPCTEGYPPPLSCNYPLDPHHVGAPCYPCGPCAPCSTTCDPCYSCGPCGSPCCSSCPTGSCGSSCSCCGPCGPCSPCGPCGPCSPCGPCGPCGSCGPCPCPRPASPSQCPAACTPQKLYDERTYSPYGCVDEYEPPKCKPPCDDPFVQARQAEKQDLLFKRSPICPCDNTCMTPCRGTPCA